MAVDTVTRSGLTGALPSPAAPAPTAAPAPAAAPRNVAAYDGVSGFEAAAPPADDFAARRAQYALPVDGSRPAKAYDGMYIGADGYAYPPDRFKASEVPPFRPQNPPPGPIATTYHVNGILTEPSGSARNPDGTFQDPVRSIQAEGEAQKLANTRGTNVVLIYNATEGFAEDAAQTFADANRLPLTSNPAATTLANAMYEDIQAGREVHVSGYSQGGAVVSRALYDLHDRITADQGGALAHLPFFGEDNRAERDRKLGLIHVTTFGGASGSFPDGPSYDHYVNTADVVPVTLGLTPVGNAGRGARMHYFFDPGTTRDPFHPDGPHGYTQYLREYEKQQTGRRWESGAPR